jgi:hypothetical protein
MSSSGEEEEEEEPQRIEHIFHMDEEIQCDRCSVTTKYYYENLYDNCKHEYVCVHCTEKEPQEMTITFRFTRALLHEGDGGSREQCRKCGERNKRYYRLCLTNGENAFICRSCFVGKETGYDQSWSSD